MMKEESKMGLWSEIGRECLCVTINMVKKKSWEMFIAALPIISTVAFLGWMVAIEQYWIGLVTSGVVAVAYSLLIFKTSIENIYHAEKAVADQKRADDAKKADLASLKEIYDEARRLCVKDGSTHEMFDEWIAKSCEAMKDRFASTIYDEFVDTKSYKASESRFKPHEEYRPITAYLHGDGREVEREIQNKLAAKTAEVIGKSNAIWQFIKTEEMAHQK